MSSYTTLVVVVIVLPLSSSSPLSVAPSVVALVVTSFLPSSFPLRPIRPRPPMPSPSAHVRATPPQATLLVVSSSCVLNAAIR
ncbi:hypothetical protein CC85DRAFT_288440 [Cutaneotrichosporon oleaginosum]|uniref:Secreted peptide n=1 Tax=Cutaneotrichosporon oleaginosum TaxID=879819 RepID=A0A0J0XEP8_9TREE|nr:uncharacterized protein CC85DRAFT_288440 [Cutaneotrichosporon oleaginosum]KLT39523.1 hypothetical protein CC85DRAFT_288440 [Cutaneotrichosporon oleaginosum]TXT07078.1 hypothetical protein COLE_06409 [Cutaneotrichosporon oleaginosum]